MRFVPHEYQMSCLKWLIQRTIIDGQVGGAFFLDPGLGKTSTTLLYLLLLKKLGLIKKILIVAPLRVVYSVWPKECQKWDQFKQLKCSIVHGSPTQRMKALANDADIYLINPEGVPWLQNYFDKKPIPFDVLAVDESTKFKAWSSGRTKALRKLAPRFKYRLILTGTPSPNGLEDLFSQIYLLDLGESLGPNVSKFRERYFYRGGFGGYQWLTTNGSDVAIQKKISHLCMRLSAEDYLDLPDLVFNDVWVDLPSDVLKAYKKLEREMFLELDTSEVIVGNAGAKYLACRQVANGGIYDQDKKPAFVHGAKVDAIADLVDELQGKPALVAFQFRHDLERLRKVWPKAPSIDGSVGAKQADKTIDDWNAGKLPLLLVQPQSLSHGINMQSGPGRDIIWMGLQDSLETYLQLNARIYRQGVTGQVRIHRVLANRTVDLAIRDRIESKDQNQNALLEALSKYRDMEGAHE